MLLEYYEYPVSFPRICMRSYSLLWVLVRGDQVVD